MKQYKITSADIFLDNSDDCYLAPDDPIHELKLKSYLGGLGATSRIEQYRIEKLFKPADSDESK